MQHIRYKYYSLIPFFFQAVFDWYSSNLLVFGGWGIFVVAGFFWFGVGLG